MADPVSIIGTVGALANIIQLVSQTISGIRDLQSDWKDANLSFLSLLGQLSTLRVALMKIDAWMKSDLGDAHHQLVLDLDATMDCCGILLTNLQESVAKLQQGQDQTLDFQSKVRLMFGKKGISDIQRLLEHQTNALTLLLAACNCETSTEQNALLVRSSSRRTFRQLNNDSASLLVHRDSASISTQTTDGLSKLSLAFSFDQEVFTSSVYERYFRGAAKKVLRNPRKHDSSAIKQPRIATNQSHDWRQYQDKLLLFGYEDTKTDEFVCRMFGSTQIHPPYLSMKFERVAVYRYLIINVKRLIMAPKSFGMEFNQGIHSRHSSFLFNYVDDLNPARPLDARVGRAIKSLWRNPAVQRARMRRPMTPLIHLLGDIDRIAAPDYTPTATDMHAVRGRSLAVIEIQATYEGTGAKRIFLEGRVLDVTLRFMAPESDPRFNASVDYDFTNISKIVLLVNQSSNHIGASSQPRHDGFIECVRCLSSAMKAFWFPRDRRVIFFFNDFNVEPNQARGNFEFVGNWLHRELYPPIHLLSQMEFVHPHAEPSGGFTVNILMDVLG